MQKKTHKEIRRRWRQRMKQGPVINEEGGETRL
jgi:hypothetical protein